MESILTSLVSKEEVLKMMLKYVVVNIRDMGDENIYECVDPKVKQVLAREGKFDFR